MIESDPKQDKSDLEKSGPAESKSEDLVKIVDRRGRKKEIPRSEYERKQRRKRRREHRSIISLRNLFSVAFIIAIMVAAVYIAIKIVS
jgi:hypothetical protein